MGLCREADWADHWKRQWCYKPTGQLAEQSFPLRTKVQNVLGLFWSRIQKLRVLE